jgi:glycosyltransferase involved in cell wall biosynthesis
VWAYVESAPVDPDWVKGFNRIDQLVTCVDFAKRLLSEALNLKNASDISIIPFGVDTSTFRPLDTAKDSTIDRTIEAKARLRIFQEGELNESFIVLNANRNQPRKRMDSTIKAFSEFAKGKPNNVKLYLHMGQQDAGWNVIKLSRRFGIEDRLIMSDSGGLVPDISDQDMNLIYNACDVGLNTSACEGWGLVAFEHAAVGRAQVMTDSPQLRELWEGSAILAPVNRMVVHEGTLLNGYLVDEDRLSRILENLYCDNTERLKWSKNALEKATKPEYSWDSIARSWEAKFRELVGVD